MERTHIGIFGKVNAGKSSIINRLTGQSLAVVSSEPGTTTDPVRKAMEILPIGPVMFYDTAGLSDDSSLGELRIEKTLVVLRQIDFGLVIMDAAGVQKGCNFTDETKLIGKMAKNGVPYLVILNKTDTLAGDKGEEYLENMAQKLDTDIGKIIQFTATNATEQDVWNLRERIANEIKKSGSTQKPLVSDLIKSGDTVVMVVPIDEAAPKGRIILPQQQVLRDILDANATAIVTQPAQLRGVLEGLKEKPKLVITDSQAFNEVKTIVPKDCLLTSFSILMARFKGDLEWQAAGARVIESLKDGDKVLISEGCTHHRQCGDIGTVKLPEWIKQHTGKDFNYEFTGGGEFPEILRKYALIIHCGGCTLPPKEMQYRIERAREGSVPMTNYGTMIAYLNGILERALAPLEK